MAWHEAHSSLPQHPKTKRARRILNVSVPTMVGHLHILWSWCVQYAPDGDLARFDDEDIADGALWDGDPALFVSALRDSGFLDTDRTVHDWDQYGGRLHQKRLADAERKRTARAASDVSDGRPPDVARTAHVEDIQDIQDRTERGQDKQDNGAGAPDDVDTDHVKPQPKPVPDPPGFAAFWAAYPKGHGSRKASADQWRRLKPDAALRADIMTGLAMWTASRRWREGYVKDAERWLKDRLWENPPDGDEPVVVARSNGRQAKAEAVRAHLLAAARGET